MPLLLLDILRGRKVWEEEEEVGEEAERGRERTGLCAVDREMDKEASG